MVDQSAQVPQASPSVYVGKRGATSRHEYLIVRGLVVSVVAVARAHAVPQEAGAAQLALQAWRQFWPGLGTVVQMRRGQSVKVQESAICRNPLTALSVRPSGARAERYLETHNATAGARLPSALTIAPRCLYVTASGA